MTSEEILNEWNKKKVSVEPVKNDDNVTNERQETGDCEMTREEELKAEIEMLKAQLQNRNEEISRLRSEESRIQDGAVMREPGNGAKAANYFAKYVETECTSHEERENLTQDVETFWDRLKGYQTEANGHRAYGLAVGRVQSGKTRNYIGLMFKAIDDGYNTIIILTSKNNQLAVQTHERVAKCLRVVGNSQFLTRIQERIRGVEWLGGDFSANRVHVGVVIKNEGGHLERVREWVDSLGMNVRSRMKLLFIDDESDSATPNTNNAGEPGVRDESDVRQISAMLRENGCGNGGNFVADWIEDICVNKNIEDSVDGVSEVLKRIDTKRAMRNALLNDRFKQAVSLDREVEVNGKKANLNELACDIFDKRATKNQPFNWAVLRDLLNYAFGIRQERSRINRSICQLVGQSEECNPTYDFNELIYAAYTATPFANLVNENPVNDPLCPDCIKSLSSNSKYFGLTRIFGDDDDACNMNIVRNIKSDESVAWIETLQNGEVQNNDVALVANDLCRVHNFAENTQLDDIRSVEWKTLKRAVMWAFCSAAARRIHRLQGQHAGDFADIKYRWTTMLFNLSHLSNQEGGVHKVQQELLKRYLDHQTNEQKREEFIKDCCAVWEEETRRFSADDFKRAYPGYGEPTEYPAVDDIKRELSDWFLGKAEKYQVIQMNSHAWNLDQKDYYDGNATLLSGDVLWFVCGGNAISRGLTLEGLTVSYYDRIKRSTTVDSITQMGRWFGYRIGYELLPRIWMTDDTIAEMKNICRIEEHLHNDLQDFFEDDDRSSIRTGRNVADIMYFGRRLSGRDANGMEIGSSGTDDVFEIVDENPDRAFKRTQQFLEGIGGVNSCWKKPDNDYNHSIHQRHRYFWTDVSRDVVRLYLEDMENCCFRGASKSSALGLVREIHNSLESWNVVVGNPATQMGQEIFQGISTNLRGNTVVSECGVFGVKRIGKKHLTVNAYYTALPESIIRASENEVRGLQNRRGNDVTGKMQTLEIAFAKMRHQAENAVALKPTLLIDFVANGDGTPFVQVSFYWYGHNAGSFYRAIITPDAPALLPDALETIGRQRYISFVALKRILARKHPELAIQHHSELTDDDLSKSSADLLKKELMDACREVNARIGVVADAAADEAVLGHNVFYSVDWIRNADHGDGKVAGHLIGSDLYKKIIENNWNDYGTNGLLNYNSLTENDLDLVMAYDFWARQYKWDDFRRKYAANEPNQNQSFIPWNGRSGNPKYKKGLETIKEIKCYEQCDNPFLKALAHKGFDMKEKYKIAVDHFSAAANCGHPFAKFQLGMMCQSKNPERARGFFDSAKPDLEILAAEGNGEAKECLKYLMDNDANRGDN